MADPVSGTIMAVSALAQAGGGLIAGQQEASAYKFNAAQERSAADIARANSQAEARQIETDNERRAGEAGAAIGASGVVANTGTPLQAMSDLATQGALQKQFALYRGSVEALGHENQAQADMTAASGALKASWIKAGTTLLSAAAQGAMAQFKPSTPAGGFSAQSSVLSRNAGYEIAPIPAKISAGW
jgi:hypothetical protein